MPISPANNPFSACGHMYCTRSAHLNPRIKTAGSNLLIFGYRVGMLQNTSIAENIVHSQPFQVFPSDSKKKTFTCILT